MYGEVGLKYNVKVLGHVLLLSHDLIHLPEAINQTTSKGARPNIFSSRKKLYAAMAQLANDLCPSRKEKKIVEDPLLSPLQPYLSAITNRAEGPLP